MSKSVGNIDPTHRFNGKELDPETGLYYYGGRYYDPEISRFISADPFIPQPGNPQSLNRYSYTLNNPQNYIDPSGFFFGALFKAIGNFFKSIFKNPGVFFATLTVGLVTGGVASYAGASWALAGAIGGASAGAVGAAMTGGNIWQGALIGGIAGGAGGGTFGALGGVKAGFGAVLGGALVGGATAGALNTAFNGGNFLVNVFSGAITSGITAAAVYGVGKGLEQIARVVDAPQGPADTPSTKGCCDLDITSQLDVDLGNIQLAAVPGRPASEGQWPGYPNCTLGPPVCYDPQGIRPPVKLTICENNSCIYNPPSGLNPGGVFRDIGTGEIIPRAAYFHYRLEKYGTGAVIQEMIQKYGGLPEK